MAATTDWHIRSFFSFDVHDLYRPVLHDTNDRYTWLPGCFNPSVPDSAPKTTSVSPGLAIDCVRCATTIFGGEDDGFCWCLVLLTFSSFSFTAMCRSSFSRASRRATKVFSRASLKLSSYHFILSDVDVVSCCAWVDVLRNLPLCFSLIVVTIDLLTSFNFVSSHFRTDWSCIEARTIFLYIKLPGCWDKPRVHNTSTGLGMRTSSLFVVLVMAVGIAVGDVELLFLPVRLVMVAELAFTDTELGTPDAVAAASGTGTWDTTISLFWNIPFSNLDVHSIAFASPTSYQIALSPSLVPSFVTAAGISEAGYFSKNFPFRSRKVAMIDRLTCLRRVLSGQVWNNFRFAESKLMNF